MSDVTHNAIGLFVQDYQTKMNLSTHSRYGCTFQQAAVVSRAFAGTNHSSSGEVVVLHKYRCLYKVVGEVTVVGVCLTDAHVHPTLSMLNQAVTAVRSLLKDRGDSLITSAALRKKNTTGELLLCLEEILHQSQVGVPDVPPDHQTIMAGKAYSTPHPFTLMDSNGQNGKSENMRLALASLHADTTVSTLTKAAHFSLKYDHDDEPESAKEDIDLNCFLPFSSGGGGARQTIRRSVDREGEVLDFIQTSQGAAKVGRPKTPPMEPTKVGDLDDIFTMVSVTAPATPPQTLPPTRASPPSAGLRRGSALDEIFGSPAVPKPPKTLEYNISVMTQETVSAAFVSGDGGGWSIVGDVLLLGKSAIVPANHESPGVKEVLYLKIDGPSTADDVRPNPTYAKLIDPVRLIYVIELKQVEGQSASAPVCVIKYRQETSATPVFPVKAKMSWNPMPKEETPDVLLEQATLQWAGNPYVTLSSLSFHVLGGSASFKPTRQQSKPEGIWDEAAGKLTWRCIESGTVVAAQKLQARMQSVAIVCDFC